VRHGGREAFLARAFVAPNLEISNWRAIRRVFLVNPTLIDDLPIERVIGRALSGIPSECKAEIMTFLVEEIIPKRQMNGEECVTFAGDVLRHAYTRDFLRINAILHALCVKSASCGNPEVFAPRVAVMSIRTFARTRVVSLRTLYQIAIALLAGVPNEFCGEYLGHPECLFLCFLCRGTLTASHANTICSHLCECSP
jgi:hypothetical protein